MKNIKLKTAVILIILTLISASLWAEDRKNIYENLSGKDFSEKIRSMEKTDSYSIIDVRTAAEYNAGRIEGAENIDFYDADFRNKMKQLDKSKTYFIYCRSGSRSGQTLNMMESLGFKEVYNLGRGIISGAGNLRIIK